MTRYLHVFSYFIIRIRLDIVLDSHRDLLLDLIRLPVIAKLNWSIPNLLGIEEINERCHNWVILMFGILIFIIKWVIYNRPALYPYERESILFTVWIHTRSRSVILFSMHYWIVPYWWIERVKTSFDNYPAEVIHSLKDYNQFWYDIQSHTRIIYLVRWIAYPLIMTINKWPNGPSLWSLMSILLRLYTLWDGIDHSPSKTIWDSLVIIEVLLLTAFITVSYHVHLMRQCLKIETKQINGTR